MPQIRMRLRHASTGADQVLVDSDFVEGEVERLTSADDQLQTTGEVTVEVEVAELMGHARKPLSPGRHRVTIEERDGDGWRTISNGVVTNESVAHGRRYASGVRRWSVTVSDSASEEAWSRLEGVQLRTAAETRALTDGHDVEWIEAGGGSGGLGTVTRAAWRLDALTLLAFDAAGLPDPGAPAPYGDVLDGVVPTVALCAPRPEGTLSVPQRTVPAWTGAQLVEYRCEAEQLILEAGYAPWPSVALDGVALRRASVELPAPGSPEFDALVNLDDDGTGEPWYEDYDWSTEPGDVDGEVLDDFALVYLGGPDGSYVGGSGEILELPLEATYAARKRALTGQRKPGRDGGREVANKQELELPVLLAPAEASSADGTAFSTVEADGYSVDLSRPVYDYVDGKPDEEAVYLVSLARDAGGACARGAAVGPTAGRSARCGRASSTASTPTRRATQRWSRSTSRPRPCPRARSCCRRRRAASCSRAWPGSFNRSRGGPTRGRSG